MKYLEGYTNHLLILENIVRKSGDEFEGNCFYYHKTFETDNTFEPKHKNIMDIALKGNNIIEIGFNAGHSAFLMLISNPHCFINVFDICMHTYTIPCFNYLNEQFGNRMKLHIGNSHTTLEDFHKNNPDYKFDVIHIDGNHEYNHANIDFFLSKKMAKVGSYYIFDDTNIYYLKNLWDGYIRDGHLEEIIVRDTGKHKHSIGRHLR